MSDSARADRAAFAELDRLVRALGDELTFFRRRALEAERRLRELSPEAAPAADGAAPQGPATAQALRGRVAELERENADLRARLDEAASRAKQMAERVRFLRQQQEASGER